MIGKVGSIKFQCKDQLVKVEPHEDKAHPEQLYLIGGIEDFSERLASHL